MKNVIRYLQKIAEKLNTHIKESDTPVVTFGIFGVINYPLFFIIWQYFIDGKYVGLWMRLLAGCFCLLLIVKDYWPEKLKPYFSFFWYITVLYCLPFFGTYSFLDNHGSIVWITNAMLVLFWLILAVDWISFIIILPLGILLAYFCYTFTGKPIYMVTTDTAVTLTNYVWAVGIGAAFARKRKQIQQTRFNALKTISASMAHELRTPLAAIHAAADGMKTFFPELLRGYNYAREKNLEQFSLRNSQLAVLNKIPEHIEYETQMANTVINMLLVRSDPSKIEMAEMVECSIAQCINEALIRYPFLPGDKQLIHWNANNDFIFKGQELLTIHVLFNLIKNAVHYIKEASKGDIHIWLVLGAKWNKLYFRDTGKGISSKVLPQVFDQFFSQTRHGAGVGLAFCRAVMQSYSGSITCESVENEYTEFVLSFPMIASIKDNRLLS